MGKEIFFEAPISCLRRLIEHDQSQNFEIVVKITSNDSKQETKKIEIKTSINKARIISKNINDIFLIDPTVNKYEINYQVNSNDSTQTQNKITEIMNKIFNSIEKSVTIEEEEQNDFYRLLIQLGEKTSSNENEVHKRINNIDEAISLLSTEFHNSAILYLSERMKDFLSKSFTDQINIEIIKEIIDSYFDIRDEKQKQKGEEEKEETEIYELFEIMTQKEEEISVIMHFLMKLKVEEMNEQIIDYIYQHLDDDIMTEEFSQIFFIIRHHYLKILKKETKKTKEKVKKIESTIEYNGNELKGIFDFLKRTYGENLENNGILKISGGGDKDGSYPLTNLIKSDSDQYYYNYHNRKANEGEGWIEFDFCERKINLSSYTIRTNNNNENWNHPKSWQICGSNDKEKWDIIDQQTENSILRGFGKQHRFECSKKDNNYYRYIKYIQDDNWNSNRQKKFNIYLTCIEFFGSISAPNEN